VLSMPAARLSMNATLGGDNLEMALKKAEKHT
jgi:hypothetical protein